MQISYNTQNILNKNDNYGSVEEQLTYRPASGRSILRHAGTWEGDDFEECLQAVYATRGLICSIEL